MGEDFRVNFLIVGTQKGGTTALSHFLSQHPEICMAACKETHLFDDPEFDDTWSVEEINRRYKSFFENYQGEQFVGEATPIYMYLRCIAPRICKYNHDMKLIFLLRDPAERAISHYHMERNRNNDRLPLLLALITEPWRLWRDRNDYSKHSALRLHSYIDRGRYSKQVAYMSKYFSSQQMLFLSSEELFNGHDAALTKVYTFLGIKDHHIRVKSQRIFEGNYSQEHSKMVLAWLEWRLRHEREIVARYCSNIN